MKSLHIRGVPEKTVDRLKLRALRHHRSLQGELLALLDEAAGQVVDSDPDTFELLTVKGGGRQNWSRDEIYDD